MANDPLDFPNLDELRERWQRFRRTTGGAGGPSPPGTTQPPWAGSRRLVTILLLLLAGWLAFASFYTVQPEERAIVLRLGRYRGVENDAGPGLHFKLPLLDRVFKVPVERQLKQEYGFRTQTQAGPSTFRSVEEEATMLTGDENVAIVEWVVQYRIADPYRYLFRVRNVEQAFRDLSEAVMRQVVGDRTVNEVVTIGRVEIERDTEQLLQELCDQYETGIKVEEVLLQSNNPPEPVKPSFNDVNQAEQDRNKLINEAQAAYNRVIPRADGEARQAIEQAEGYALDRVNRAQGDATRFDALFTEYRKAPEVTRKRLYLESMARLLPAVGRKVVVGEDVEGMIPMLSMETSPRAGAAAATQPGGGS
jgi:modulator of FtsH protease HflK